MLLSRLHIVLLLCPWLHRLFLWQHTLFPRLHMFWYYSSFVHTWPCASYMDPCCHGDLFLWATMGRCLAETGMKAWPIPWGANSWQAVQHKEKEFSPPWPKGQAFWHRHWRSHENGSSQLRWITSQRKKCMEFPWRNQLSGAGPTSPELLKAMGATHSRVKLCQESAFNVQCCHLWTYIQLGCWGCLVWSSRWRHDHEEGSGKPSYIP